jgi:hypothetical protein
MEAHLKAFHPGHNQPSHLSTAFLTLCTIKHEEHIAMGIPQEQILPSSFPPSADSSGSGLASIVHPRVPKRQALELLPSPQKPKIPRRSL